MSLQALKKSIVHKAQEQAAKHSEEVASAIRDQERITHEEISAQTQKKETDYSAEKEFLDIQSQTHAHSEAKKQVMQASSAVLMSSKAAALAAMDSFDSAQKKALYTRMITFAQTVLAPTKIYCPKRDVTLVKHVTKIPVQGDAELEGIRCTGKNANQSVTITFEQVIDTVFAQNEQSIMEKLLRLQ